ncbi:hypothetical protein DPMN_039343 [Dreissena polymorpha]|uniref:C2H2-type domain-containing protein n=1 Tax=Dreissena polymorpha TaxID=45954 RepID=A0A9D4MFT5_DREPO|nr:hypothetical protein DPMN_039343 [Dreissena polymorpha]
MGKSRMMLGTFRPYAKRTWRSPITNVVGEHRFGLTTMWCMLSERCLTRKQHKEPKQRRCSAQKCKESCEDSSAYSYHIRVFMEEQVGCDKCRMVFKTRKTYQQHVWRVHQSLDED